ncbi:hypothetical protein RV15_GL001765 [Enterococcus silesiacus]|nr:hypothetical protein RV15_GL001765 [Enterococcus silesiacus]
MDSYLEELSNVDAVIIMEEQNIGQTCRFILDIYNNSEILTYVWMSAPSENNKALYLQLGADGVCSDEIEVSTFLLLVNNALNRFELYRKKILHEIEATQKSCKAKKSSMLEMIPENFSVLVNGKEEVNMTKLEYIVLDILYSNAGKALSYQEIGDKAWKQQSQAVQKYRVANVIFHIRGKIKKNDNGIEFIKTIRSKGYMLDDQALKG